MRAAPVAWFLIVLVGLAGPASGSPLLIADMVGLVDQAQYTLYQRTIEDMGLGLYGGSDYNQGYRGRDASPTGGTDALGNQECRLYLDDQLASMGLSTAIQGTYRNVVAELPGVETPQNIYIVGAHYDHVGGIPRPGGDDNASGVAGVLEAARILSQYHFGSTIRFIGFNAEEDNLLGSKDYVANVVQASGENVLGMISLDMILRPYNDKTPSAPIDLDLACPNSADDLAWANVFSGAAAAYVPTLVIDPDSPHTTIWGASDHQPFASAGYAAFLAIENSALEIWGGGNAYYHTADDWSGGPAGAHYDYAFATDVVRTVVAAFAQQAGVVLAVTGWEIAADHGTAGELVTPVQDGYTEPREGGLRKLRVAFERAVDPATLGPGAVTVTGQAAGDVSSLIGSLVLDPTGKVLTISLLSPPPDRDIYTIAVTGQVQDTRGCRAGGDTAVTVVALAGDVDGSGTVTEADMVLVRSMVGAALDGATARFDVNRSGDVTGQDMRTVRTRLGGHLGIMSPSSLAALGAGSGAPAPIRVEARLEADWVYQNTERTTEDRHATRLTIIVNEDPNANTRYETWAVQTAGAARVTIRETADPFVWEVLGGRADESAPGDVTVQVFVGGADVGGEGGAAVAMTVRRLGDVDGDGEVTAADAAELCDRLNGRRGRFADRSFDVEGDAAVTVTDLVVLTRILNRLTVP